ncbi:MAG: hypothetical protein AB1813_09805 [Verrucomicrobiota bacterium]
MPAFNQQNGTLSSEKHASLAGHLLCKKRVHFVGNVVKTAKMYPQVDTKDPSAVEAEVQSTYRSMFPQGNELFVPRAFFWAIDCFTGHYRDYQQIDARYHDFEHTLQGTLCMVRLLDGRYRANIQPELNQRIFELGLLAILLHDTGYLKKKGDCEGTGAKYTLVHVTRSMEFAAELLREKGFSPADIKSVQNMIRCTGVNVDLTAIPFCDELERTVGYALGTADLLGQMAANDYVDKLPILYQEFAESDRYNKACGRPAKAMFSSAQDLVQKTPMFWEKYVQPKINLDFRALYRFLNHPYPDGPNFYIDRITENIDRLRNSLNMLTA